MAFQLTGGVGERWMHDGHDKKRQMHEATETMLSETGTDTLDESVYHAVHASSS